MAGNPVGSIQVEGLGDLARALRTVEPALKKELPRANKEFVRPLAEEARSEYRKLYERGTGKGERSIRPLASATRAQIAIGRANVPYMLGQEFGSTRYPQFRPWSGKGPGGRGSKGKFLYPTVRRMVPLLVDKYDAVLQKVMRRAFPKGR